MDWLNEIGGQQGIKVSVWSLWDVRDFTKVPFPGCTKLVYDGGWGEPGSVTIPENATWVDLWKAAEQLIIKSDSDDLHHVFIEKYELQEPGVVTFWCGS